MDTCVSPGRLQPLPDPQQDMDVLNSRSVICASGFGRRICCGCAGPCGSTVGCRATIVWLRFFSVFPSPR